jgi:hypothetical protein
MITSAPYTGNIIDFEKAITQSVFLCNENGNWHACKQCKCPADAIYSHRRKVEKILEIIYGHCADMPIGERYECF